ncbi:pleiotropic regulatory protein RsmS [Oceanisphaera sp. KMM 10153]|uniref:pleiotropic regulatory protein RsmS n=1 Tax=Oceanisphaera submarina TaxID=3390193 RepID=UPI003974BE0E
MDLSQAPAEVKLAVDLIELLEVNQIEPTVALAALAMVIRDFERKRAQKKPETGG